MASVYCVSVNRRGLKMTVEFKPWPKIQRPKNSVITITEKMDGTNACVIVQNGEVVGCQSRNRLIKPGDDNMGFAQWVHSNLEPLSELGDGYHYGEWCGPGIQKNPHKLEEKAFFLFNTHRPKDTLPDVVDQVPLLYQGPLSEEAINKEYSDLWKRAADQMYTPEGIMVYYHQFKQYLKYTYANQDGKWNA